MKPAFTACAFGFYEIIDPGKKIAVETDLLNTLRKTCVQVAARHGNRKILEILLKTTDSISVDVMEAAAGNEENGQEVMTLLLEQYGEEVGIPESVIIAAAGNEVSGQKVTALLRDHYQDRDILTESVVRAAAGNQRNGNEVMALLINRCKDQNTITKKHLSHIAANSDAQVWRIFPTVSETRLSTRTAPRPRLGIGEVETRYWHFCSTGVETRSP